MPRATRAQALDAMRCSTRTRRRPEALAAGDILRDAYIPGYKDSPNDRGSTVSIPALHGDPQWNRKDSPGTITIVANRSQRRSDEKKAKQEALQAAWVARREANSRRKVEEALKRHILAEDRSSSTPASSINEDESTPASSVNGNFPPTKEASDAPDEEQEDENRITVTQSTVRQRRRLIVEDSEGEDEALPNAEELIRKRPKEDQEGSRKRQQQEGRGGIPTDEKPRNSRASDVKQNKLQNVPQRANEATIAARRLAKPKSQHERIMKHTEAAWIKESEKVNPAVVNTATDVVASPGLTSKERERRRKPANTGTKGVVVRKERETKERKLDWLNKPLYKTKKAVPLAQMLKKKSDMEHMHHFSGIKKLVNTTGRSIRYLETKKNAVDELFEEETPKRVIHKKVENPRGRLDGMFGRTRPE